MLLLLVGWLLCTSAGGATTEAVARDDLAAEAAALASAEERRIERLLKDAAIAVEDARAALGEEHFGSAFAALEVALDRVPNTPFTTAPLDTLRAQRRDLLRPVAELRLQTGDVEGARQALLELEQAGPLDRAARRLQRRIEKLDVAPRPPRPQPADPAVATPDDLLTRGRAEFAAGAYQDAEGTFLTLLEMEPQHPEALASLIAVAEAQREADLILRERSRVSLLHEVEQGWQRPRLSQEGPHAAALSTNGESPLQEKLSTIRIPVLNFQGLDLQRVATTLSELSSEYDPSSDGAKGVNIVLIDPQGRNPTVSLTLRNLTLKRVLDFITDTVGYQYEVQADAVVIRPGGEVTALDTDFFAVTRSTVIRMTGLSGGTPIEPAPVDPFAPLAPAPATAGGGAEAQALQAFLQQAGVNFEGTPGASLAYDGSAMIVTQTARNLERIRNILNRYNDVRQVEIEAKFMEVQQGALEELGVNWSLTHGRGGDPAYRADARSQNRSLAQGFTHTVSGQPGRIVNPGRETEVIRNPDGTIFEVVPGQNAINQPIVNQAASLPNGADLAAQAGPLAIVAGTLGEFDVEATIRALSRHAGTDLLSAPRVTVLSGNPATITVAQEMRFPQSYGEIQSQVGSARSESSSAGVTITAGTPQDFATRNIGVELRVTPTVEEDDYSISLDLNPKVTEFEGFVEYGGQSVAISGGTTVTVPSGFFQPVFSTREVNTKVTIWDGATLVMGGLTREEVKQVTDKVPILGDIPLLGRAFRSKGQSSQKRNLLIFVTANLVSPGGSPKKQALRNVPPNSLYQNPALVTPAGARRRVPDAR